MKNSQSQYGISESTDDAKEKALNYNEKAIDIS